MDRCVLLAVLCIHIVLHVPACCGICPEGSVTERGVPAYLKPEIVHIHNEFRKRNARGQVAGHPKAANMLQLTWDESLARQAQVLADTCEFKHVKVKDPRFAVGQNLYTAFTTENKPGANWKKCVQSWFDENKVYQFGEGVYNHYTQVVWANSYTVGCGYVKYKKNNGFQRLYVCHYGPSGNMVGQVPYEVGNGCENLCLPANKPGREPIPRPPKPMTYPANIVPYAPKPVPYSPTPMPLPPKQIPYPPRPWPGSPTPRPPVQEHSGYKATREDAVVAMLLYLLIQKQAELAAQKAQAEQQEAVDNEEDEYYDEPEYEDETPPVVANPQNSLPYDNNGQYYPEDYTKYRRATRHNGNYDKKIQRQPKTTTIKLRLIKIPKMHYSKSIIRM